jgi:uncharacterized protein YndB with AHSA1/START domain
MAIVERTIEAPPEAVFAVLADGWSYSDWVVGTAHIRAVDESWPQRGAKIHHKAGPWPMSLQDHTVSLECEPNRSVVMAPHLWPLGEATVRVTLAPAGAGRTRVRLEEDFHAGPLRWLRTKVNDLALHYRNRESLRRLGDLAVRRAHPSHQTTVDGGPGETGAGDVGG